jgi:CelD/BcsL family acetyltransferase involved in cellulose biosynthesis
MNAAVRLAPEELRVEVLEGRDAFVGLEREWNAALARGPRDEPMLRHEWLRAWIENFAPGAALRTFVVRAGREICAAAPLIETQEHSADTCFLPLTTWSLPVNDHSQRGGLLLGSRWDEALELLWRAWIAAPGWDRLRLRDLPRDAPEWQLRDRAEKSGYPCGEWVSLRSPYLPLPRVEELKSSRVEKSKSKSSSTAYQSIESSLDSKFRQNLRRRRRRLEEQGAVEYRLADAKSLDEALADFLDLEASGWKGKGGTAIAQRPELVGFYTQMARDAAKRGALALGTLTLKGRPIAAHLSVVHAKRHSLIKLGYDESLHEHSPGQQLVAEAIRDSCARGLSEFDFLGPCMEWKLDWESQLRTLACLTIFRPTNRMKLVHAARYTAWPIARALLRRG